MKSSQIMIVTAVLLAAAFAGIVLTDEESDAVDAGAITNVSYTGTGVTANSITVSATATSIEIEGPTATAETDKVLYWTSASGTVYYIGQTVAIADISASDVSGGILTLTAKVGTAANVATLVIDDVNYIIPVSDSKLDAEDVAYKAAKAICDGLEEEGYMLSWTEDAKPFDTVTAGEEYILSAAVGTVEWNSNGIVTVTYSASDEEISFDALNIPQAPKYENHNFIGWALTEGGEPVIDYVAVSNEYYINGEAVTDGFDIDTIEGIESGTVVFYAVFEPVQYTITYMVGETTYYTAYVDYNTVAKPIALPEGYVAWAADAEGNTSFDFTEAIVTNETVYAVQEVPSDVFTVQFAVDGKVVATYACNAITLPDVPVKEGYEFVGWAIGDNVIADPVNYTFTADTTFIAMFQPIDVETFTVSYTDASGVSGTMEVVSGEVADLPELTEGYVWAIGDKIYDVKTPVAADITLKAVKEFYTVEFAVDGAVYSAYEQTVRYGEKAVEPTQFVFPDGYDGWDFDFNQIITSDTTVEASEVIVIDEPEFFETTSGKAVLVLIGFAILAFVACLIMNYGGLRDKLTSVKIVRTKKE